MKKLVQIATIAMVAMSLGLVFGAVVYTIAAAPSKSEEAAVTPVRLIDTRDGTGMDEAGPAHAGQLISVVTPFKTGGEVLINLKLVDPVGRGFITVWDCNNGVPLVSSLDANGTSPINNFAITRLNRFGVFCVFVSRTLTSTHVVVDLQGFTPPEVDIGTPPI